MSQTTTVTTTLSEATSSQRPAVLRLRPEVPAYLRDLDIKGYAVVPGVLRQAAVEDYKKRAYDWLEKTGHGFKRDDRSTWNVNNLPPHAKGGMYKVAGVGHEQFMWDLRSEQDLIDVFANVWGTDELLVSYDGINLALPLPDDQYDTKGKPWPHVDQSPLRDHLHCVQGIVALSDSGSTDGGLMILEGSKSLYSEFFKAHEHVKPEEGWPARDLYLHEESQIQWFLERGCRWTKVCCEAGDVMIWDSRCVHFGATPKSENPRAAVYVCYKPAKMASEDVITQRKEALAQNLGTTHDPIVFQTQVRRPEHHAYPAAPEHPPVLTDTAKKLAGVSSY